MLTPLAIISLFTLRISNETVLIPTELCAAPDSTHAALHFSKKLLLAIVISFSALSLLIDTKEAAVMRNLLGLSGFIEVFYWYRLSLFTGLTAMFCNSSLFAGQILPFRFVNEN